MSQEQQIKKHLESGKSITPIEALKLYGCFRLGARIFDLKESGMNIQSEIVHDGGKRYARYWLVERGRAA